jgi:hypothetical protein
LRLCRWLRLLLNFFAYFAAHFFAPCAVKVFWFVLEARAFDREGREGKAAEYAKDSEWGSAAAAPAFSSGLNVSCPRRCKRFHDLLLSNGSVTR